MMSEDLRGKRVAVVGMGKSNQSLTRYLVKQGADVTCFDQKRPEDLKDAYRALGDLGVSWSLGEDYLKGLKGFKYVFLTPGMKKNLPEIEEARRSGAVVSMEIPLLLDLLEAKVAGVTGSAGKTTTATLTGAMLRESLPQKKVWVGGNIGSVLIEEVDRIASDDLVVLELSSFQLELVKKSPHVSSILNIRPNHLDVHDSFEDYVEAKKNIFRYQGADDWCVLNLDDDATESFGPQCPGRTALFSLDADKALARHRETGSPVAYLIGCDLMVSGDPRFMPGLSQYPQPTLLAKRDEMLVPGSHNVANALAASLMTLLLGGNPLGIRRTLKTFRGVEHRIEFVRELNGVKFYNDSIATSPDRTEALLDAVPGRVVLILGGYDKGIPFDGLAKKLAGRAEAVVTLGKTASKIESDLEEAKAAKGSDLPKVIRASELEEAVRLAYSLAEPPCSVALSPACASYDMFANFEERGRLFKDIVRSFS